MAKTRKFYYAVKKGRDGPKVYDSWEECRMTVTRYSRAEFKKFRSLADAEAWILPALKCLAFSVLWNPFPDGLIFFSSLSAAEELTQEPTQPMSAEPEPLNIATSREEDYPASIQQGTMPRFYQKNKPIFWKR
ncbi:hypothetical protein EI94DRAFT_105373 [Lactarius quietus]|nr:hypothetical protein EI94DRAFT_105373 [Lactarius quietus]